MAAPTPGFDVRSTARPAPRPGRGHVLALLAVLALAIPPRIAAFRALPDWFGPGDPATYHAMAVGCLRDGAPRIDFVWHFLTRPPSVSHVEDYYEPAFAWLLAIPVALTGGAPGAGKWLALACGLLSVALVAWRAGRHGAGVACVAGALVAIEPWSIYYSAVVMKEATVTVATLAFLAATERLLADERAGWSAGVAAGLLAVLVGLVQYELLPILFVTALAATLIHRRRALPGLLTGFGVAMLTLVVVTERAIGVPVSAKVGFFLGRSLWTPESTAVGGLGPGARLLPARYVVEQVLAVGSPVLLVLAALGARFAAVPRLERTLVAAFVLAFLAFHGVPRDLWARDFIPVVAVVAPWAALALCGAGGWRERRWALPLATTLLALAAGGPLAWRLVRAAGLTPERGPWTNVAAATLGLAALAALGASALRRPQAFVRGAVVVALVGAIVAGMWRSLPLTAIPGNPQFPAYAARRAHLQAVGAELRRRVSSGVLMSRESWQLQADTGLPCVQLPDPPTPAAIDALRARYAVAWLLVGPEVEDPGVTPAADVTGAMEVDDAALASLTREAPLAIADYRLYRLAQVTKKPGAFPGAGP